MTSQLHPWLSSREAVRAAEKAAEVPLVMMSGPAYAVGRDELVSEALAILTECALPPRDRPDRFLASGVCSAEGCGNQLTRPRSGSPAKFCSPACRKLHAKRVTRTRAGNAKVTAEALPLTSSASHIGSMHEWPEDQRVKYAIRTVGYVLCNWLRTRRPGAEISASDMIANMNVPTPVADDTPREFIENFLESRGLQVTGAETFLELCEAARNLKNVMPVAVVRMAA